MTRPEALIKSFETAIHLSKGTRIQRLLKSPTKLAYSKFLELISVWFRQSFSLKANTFWDEQMLVVIPERVSLSIYRYGFFEEDLTRMLLEYLEPGMTFIDVGAHFGYFTVLGAFIVGNKGQIHSFEPTQSSFDILRANVSNRNNVILNRNAVSSEQKTVSINDYGIRYSAFNSMYEARLPRYIKSNLTHKRFEITAIPIDEYVEIKNIKPSFVKVDAERCEYEILVSMQETIDKFRPIVSIEVGDEDLQTYPSSKSSIDFLMDRNYTPYEFNDGKIMKHTVRNEQYRSANILFMPS